MLELTARGLPNRRIAEALGLSEHTVKFHLGALYRKLQVRNRTEAVASYLQAIAGQTSGGQPWN